MFKNIHQKEFIELMNKDNVIVLDVRTKEECSVGMINGAINYDFMSSDFKTQLSQLDRNKTYLVYCRSGNRSGQACLIMQGLGFNELFNLEGGTMFWTGKLL